MNKPLPGLANAKFCPRYTFLCVPRNVRFSKWQRVPDWHRQGVVVANAPDSVASQAANKTFMDELRSYAMKLHTKEQAPREGKAESPKQQTWAPTKEGYLHFLVESRVVYGTFDEILKSSPVSYYTEFWGTGLERTAALEKDIAYMEQHFKLTAPVPTEDGPGHQYRELLKELAISNPPAFVCHFYNFYFAHTAGGRMIGQKVSQLALDGWMGDFYKWDSDVKALLSAVRERLNAVAETWSREEKDACLEETIRTFQCSGTLLGLISSH